MASTSLSEQLKRLQRPQTSHLTDLRKRPSILFDAKEAAEKDRETIYEIGLSGLQVNSSGCNMGVATAMIPSPVAPS